MLQYKMLGTYPTFMYLHLMTLKKLQVGKRNVYDLLVLLPTIDFQSGSVNSCWSRKELIRTGGVE
jgi:hypothetical protein